MFSNDLYGRKNTRDLVDIHHTVLIVLVILGGALLRLFMLTNQSLWFDEGQSLVVTDSKTLLGTFNELAAHAGGDKYQPLYFFLLSGWRSVLGDSEFSLRILSVLPGIVALFFMYATVANIYGGRHAFWSTTYLTVSAFWICYSQEVRPYALLFSLGAIQLFVLSSIFSTRATATAAPTSTPTAPPTAPPTRLRYLVFAVVTGVCCFASVLLAAFTFALALAHFITRQSTSDWMRWWVPAIFACVPAVVYLMGTPAVGELTIDSTNGRGLPLYKNSLFAIYGILVGHTFGPPLDALRESGGFLNNIVHYSVELSLLAITSMMLLTGFVYAHYSQRRRCAHTSNGTGMSKATVFFLVLLVCSFVMAVSVAKVSAINWMPRHSFYLSIPLAVLLPLAFHGYRFQPVGARAGFIRHGAHFAFVMLLGMNLYASYNYFYKSEYWRDDYRSAAGYLATQLNEMDTAIMLWGEPRLLSYYGDTLTQDRWEIDPPPVSSVMDGVYSDGGHVFVAINREFTWSRGRPTSDTLETQVADHYSLVSVKRYVNFNIYEFENIQATATTPPITTDTAVRSM